MTDTTQAAVIAEHICRSVAELPDRDSPEDWPDAMLITYDELSGIIIAALSPAPAAPSVYEDCGNCFEGETDRGHKCKVCGGTGAPAEAPANEGVSGQAAHKVEWVARDAAKARWISEDEDYDGSILEAYDRGWADRAALAAPAQGDAKVLADDSALLDWIESVGDVRVRRCISGGAVVWDVEMGEDFEVEGSSLRDALRAARKAQGGE